MSVSLYGNAAGMMAGVRWQMRPFAPAADRHGVEALWLAAMPPAWPLLRAGIALLGEGVVAEAGSDLAGFATVDRAGSIPLILVHPACQRRGIGTALLAAALDQLRAAGAGRVAAASGGHAYIWPGVPHDLPAAIGFFASRGWQRSYDTLDLVTDLRRYRTPSGTFEHVGRIGITMTQPGGAELASVLAFEEATFPNWVRWFRPPHGNILIARDRRGNITGTLLFEGPGANAVFAPMLGPAVGTIGCVGVAPHLQGHEIGTALVARASQILREAGTRNCHIGWTTRESFYRHAGYQPGGAMPCSPAPNEHGLS